jgi:peroxiredoxin
VGELRAHKNEFEALRTKVLTVTFEESDFWMKTWLAETASPFPLVVDPGQELYRLFGLFRSVWRTFSPRTLLYYTKARLSGATKEMTGSDVYQLGGDFLINRRGTIRFDHRSIDPVDRPKVAELLSLLKGDGRQGM